VTAGIDGYVMWRYGEREKVWVSSCASFVLYGNERRCLPS
jgi:hypothetical protein